MLAQLTVRESPIHKEQLDTNDIEVQKGGGGPQWIIKTIFVHNLKHMLIYFCSLFSKNSTEYRYLTTQIKECSRVRALN